MALKLFEMPPEVSGAVVECGTFKGGTAASLSLACKLVGRKLIVCDSFESCVYQWASEPNLQL